MNPHHRHAVTTLATLLALHVASSAAQPVPLINAGFETPVLDDGATQTGVQNWTTLGSGDFGTLNPSTSDYSTEAPEGSNVAYVANTTGEAGISQTLAGVTGRLQADATYALSVKVGNTALFSGFPGYRVQLLANGTVLHEDDNTLAPAEGAFVNPTVNYVYNAGLHADLVGQPLEIRLLNKGTNTTEVDFDDVQLSVTYASPVAVPGGPYTVFVSGLLFLNGSASLPSDGATFPTDASYEWDLDNDGIFNDVPVTGANPAAISQADLMTIHGMQMGGNTIRLRVTDSAAKTSTVQTSVNILPATAVVYEPFNYPGTALNGASGTTEVGLTGAWIASADSKLGPNRAYGPLVTRGAGIGDLQGGINRFGGARAVSASALKDNGLLNDGATLWFSLIMGYDSGGNVTNSRLGFALANHNFGTGNGQYFVADNLPATTGSGVGVVLGGSGVGNGKVTASQFLNAGSPSYGSLSNALYGAGQSGLIVGKITWGALNDTIELYAPDANLNLGSAISTKTGFNVDQLVFDTITWARGDKVVMDEIRFGASYQAVIETGNAWDLNGDTAGSGGPSPSGTWNTDPNWNVAADGTLVPIPWQPGGVAAFSAGNDATGAYTVTVNGSQDIGGLVVEEGTVTISGGTALRMTKDTTMSVAPGLTTTITTPLSEDLAGRQFAKAGAGTLVLSGNNAGATGGMNLIAGATQFDSPPAINGTERNITIGSGGTIVFGSTFGAGNIPAALANRVAAASAGAIAADNYDSTDFDFSTAGLTSARLGAVGAVNYTGTLTPSSGTYRLGGGGGTLTMANTNALTGANSLVVTGNVVLAGDSDYTGTTTINASATLTIAGASATSAVTLNTPNTNLILGNNNSLGTGTLTVANSFAGPGTLSAIGTVVTTNPVAANTDFIFGGSDALTIGTVTVGGARTITNNNTTDTSTITSITSTAASSLTFSGNGNTTVAGTIGGGSGITTGFTLLPGVTDTGGTLSVTWTKGAAYSGTYDTGYWVETSDSLSGAWTKEAPLPDPDVTDDPGFVKYTFPSPLGTRKFARLVVAGP